MSESSDKGAVTELTDDLYRTIFDYSGVPIIVVERDTTISAANTEFSAMSGYSREEIENRMSWTSFFAEDMIGPMLEYHHLRRSSPDMAPKRYQTRLCDKAGNIYNVLINVSLLPGSDRTIASFIDITDRLRLEEGISERDNAFVLFRELQTIFNAMPGTLSLISPDLTVAWSSRKNFRHPDQPEISVLGKKCFEIYHGRNEPCAECPIIKCFADGEKHYARVPSLNGVVWDIKGFPVKDDTGRIVCVIDFAEDITEKAQLEMDAARSAHLASIGKLAAGVAHEINNPVNGIINYAQILINRNQSPETLDIAMRIIAEGARIADIVKSLLSFARQDRDEKYPVAVRDIIEESLILGSAMLRRDAIHIEISIDNNLPKVFANAKQIQQVMLNLVSNAHYALTARAGDPNSRKLSITTHLSEDGEFVNVSFEDNGIGITPENLEKVMLPFFTTKPSGKGTGLGLSISHGIITDHGGRLTLRSSPGTSTTATVELPVFRGGS